MYDSTEQTPQRYRVYLRSTPGFYAQYDGHVDVVSRSSDRDDIFRAAVRQLARGAFFDRPSLDFWKLEKIEML